MDSQNPFKPRETPRNSLELLRWLVFEPDILKRYEKTISKKRQLLWIATSYPWVVLLTVAIYLCAAAVVVLLDLPERFPSQFGKNIFDNWSVGAYMQNFWLWAETTWTDLALGLAIGLATGLFAGLTINLVVALVGVLVVCLTASFTGGLSGLTAVLALGFTFGLSFGSTEVSSAILAGVLSVVLTGIFRGTLALGLAFILAFCISFFRLMFYPFHFIEVLLGSTIRNNPILRNAIIWLPPPFLHKKLLRDAWNEPETAFLFVAFLFEYRPLQRKLAYAMTHTATAGTWFHHPLKVDELIFPDIGEPENKYRHFVPSDDWKGLFKEVQNNLITAKKHNHGRLKKQRWEIFHESLERFGQATLKESDAWKGDYLTAIRRWMSESEKELSRLNQDLMMTEKVSPNLYRVGESLQPCEYGAQTFVGREDIRDELSFRILSSAIMPTIFLQGQRRVGKTSLLNFLQELLGSRFIVITQDMQSDEFSSISDCLNGFTTRIHKDRGIDDKTTPPPTSPIEAWKAFRTFFEKMAQEENRKIILAFDEYERFHGLVKNDSVDADELLGAMRSFSQHQNNVVFLFTGLSLFSDLGEPDFSRYFVHSHRVKVDYLKKPDAQKLITNPYEGFNLVYPPDLVEEIWRLTQGHPALLQHICSEMVNRGNIHNRQEMTPDDLDAALDIVLDRGNMVMINFWNHFCVKRETKTGKIIDDSMRQTVRQVMEGVPAENRANLLRLLDYGFISENDQTYNLRVPLFEMWIERHGESYG